MVVIARVTKPLGSVSLNRVIVDTMVPIANRIVLTIVQSTFAGLKTDTATTARMVSMANTAIPRVPKIAPPVKTLITAPGAKMVGMGVNVVTNARITAYHAAQTRLVADAFPAGSVVHAKRNVRDAVEIDFVENQTVHVYKAYVNLDSLEINVTIRVLRTAYLALTQIAVTSVKTDGTVTTVVTHVLSIVYRVAQTPHVTDAFRDGSKIFVSWSARAVVAMVFVASRMARVFKAFVRRDFTAGSVIRHVLRTASRVQLSMPVTCVAMVGTEVIVVNDALHNARRVVQTQVATVVLQGTSESLARVNVHVVVEMVCAPN